MADAELEALKRAARAGGPLQWHRLARGLERVGRAEEALVALLGAREELDARRDLARLAEVIALPLRARPRVRWSRRVTAARVRLRGGLLGLVHASRARTLVLDPDTGDTRHELESGTEPVVLAERLLLERSGRLAVHDLWSGERLGEVAVRGTAVLAWEGGVLAWRSQSETFTAHALPGGEERWRARAANAAWHPRAAGGLVFLADDAGVSAHDLASGARRWRVEPGGRVTWLEADALGLVVVADRDAGPGADRHAAAYDLAGVRVADAPFDAVPALLGPCHLVAATGLHVGTPGELVLVDRLDGRLSRYRTGLARQLAHGWAALAGDLVVTFDEEQNAVAAHGLDGGPAWELPIDALDPRPRAVRATHGGLADSTSFLAVGRRVFGRIEDVLFCLEEG